MSSTNYAASTAADSASFSDINDHPFSITNHSATLNHFNHHDSSKPEDKLIKQVNKETSEHHNAVDGKTMSEYRLGFRVFTFDPTSDHSYRKQRRMYNSELASSLSISSNTIRDVHKFSCSNLSNTHSLQVDGDSLRIITECCKEGIINMTDILYIDSLYFLYTERTSNDRWSNTPAHGYCAFISLAQLYLLYIQNNMIQRSEACILDRELGRNDIYDWIVRSIGNNVINSGFDLRNYQHQQDFEIWLSILIN